VTCEVYILLFLIGHVTCEVCILLF
jgi:hypothetical protein